MQKHEFKMLVAERVDKIKSVLTAKAEEYARGDRLSNFKKAATMLDCSPEEALLGFVSKHWVALIDFIYDIDEGVVQTQDRWDEKLGDIINYMILLEALVTERLADDTDAKEVKPDYKAMGYCPSCGRSSPLWR